MRFNILVCALFVLANNCQQCLPMMTKGGGGGGGRDPSLNLSIKRKWAAAAAAAADAQEQRRQQQKQQEESNTGKGHCELEITTKGTCFVNHNRLKPNIHVNFNPGQIKVVDHQSDEDLTVAESNDAPKKVSSFDRETLMLESLDSKVVLSVMREFVLRFIDQMKIDYGQHLDPLVINEIQFLKLKDWGRANLYNLKMYGLRHIEPGDLQLESNHTNQEMRFNLYLTVANLTSHFSVDANISDKIFIKNWKLIILMENVVLKANFVINLGKQLLVINHIRVKSFDNFRIMSEALSWPFNKIVANIVNEEKFYIRNMLELNTQKFINLTLNKDFDLNRIVAKILARQYKRSNEIISNEV